MTRPSDYTRQSILKAAIDLFAQKGFEGASVRAIVSKARVNQAAINYHFKGKEGLYLEVLKIAFDRFTLHDDSEADKIGGTSREIALRRFVSQQLRPLLARDEMSRYVHIFAWESVRPSKVLRKFLTTNAAPFLARATDLVRQFLPPHAPEKDVLCGAIWLMGQCSVFVRNREQFMQPPFSLKIDQAFVEQLTDFITALALQGLTRKM
jgi:AcrR family transcriptional regulator